MRKNESVVEEESSHVGGTQDEERAVRQNGLRLPVGGLVLGGLLLGALQLESDRVVLSVEVVELRRAARCVASAARSTRTVQYPYSTRVSYRMNEKALHVNLCTVQ